MVLQSQSPAKHNRMLGQRIPHPKSTNFFEKRDHSGEPPSKRVKRENESADISQDESQPPSPKLKARVIPDSEDEADSDAEADLPSTQTDLEHALPAIRTDAEAIEEYELGRAAEDAANGDAESRLKDRNWTRGKTSIYVDAFNLALDTVLEEERHLFDDAEIELFRFWRELSYAAQYLYVRLFLRKTSAWHRINALGYHSDIADLSKAIEELQEVKDLPIPSTPPTSNPGELEPPKGTTLGTTFTFADRSEQHIKTLEEASSLLKLDELKAIAKDVKAQGKNKQELLRNFRRTSKQQTGLKATLKRSDTETSGKTNISEGADSSRDQTPAYMDPEDQTSEENRDAHFLRKIMDETGPCIRLTLAPLKLFERVHLVFYRSTEWTEKSLTTIILARIARRNFPAYVVSRSASVFESRALLVEFEAALRTQFRVDNILEFSGRRPTQEELQSILDLNDEVTPRWRVLIAEEQRKEYHVYHSGEGAYLRRLSPAWVYTRIIHKAGYVLGKFKHHKREHEVMTELLDQKLFHHARRGAWYQRKALLEEHYMGLLLPNEGRDDETQKKHWKRIALQTCEDGLQDPLVHTAYHYDLQKRVVKLEKALNIPKRLQHDFSHVRLAKAVEVTIEGVKIEYSTLRSSSNRRNSSPHPQRSFRGTKTIWQDPLEGNGECSVEAMCLSNYRLQGWKGYHSEGGIIRTLFAYLLYDLLFTYVPNVFQTPYQTCPLDLHSDAFYPCRLSEINGRLNEISNGKAGEIIQRIWDEHSEPKTCVIGLDWSFEIADLLEIAAAFDPEALATVCRVLAQEYGQRGGGIPDLFLWHPEEKVVKFAEVKSENDRLSDTQRLWIHVLTGAGVTVELANARASEVVVID